ncbi:AB hydrolase superfamily protein [Escovopsis weberi]|uniref:AB hydrolase superfamily protein n=1 Tax=Escovopsis weberi TaxID=150374 RepID=A0A0M9VV18_ESCWE|nr:AB hydrolase superfamily protein [Escovopsis weberi]
MYSKEGKYHTIDPNFKPLPKYGYLSKETAKYAAEKPSFDAMWAEVWTADKVEKARSLELALMKKLNDEILPRQPDMDESSLEYQSRDGHASSLRVFKTRAVADGAYDRPATLVLTFHGGGCVVGSHESCYIECVNAARQGNVVAVSVQYRLAPEHAFPVPSNDCFDSLLWCKKNHEKLGIDPEKIIVAGASAGGHLAASVAIQARDQGVTGIVGQMLHCPWTCLPQFLPLDKYEMGSHFQNLDATMINYYVAVFCGDLYVPDAKPGEAHSVLLAPSHANLPPAFITIAGGDPLRDEDFAYVDVLRAAGVQAEAYIYPGMPHVFWWFTPDHPETAQFFERYGNFIKKFCE